MLDRWMADLARELELDPFPKSSEGVYTFRTLDDHLIAISEKGKELYMRCEMAPLGRKKGEREELYLSLLRDNFLSKQTGGIILGLSDDGEKMVLSYEADRPIDFPYFYKLLEQFVNEADQRGKEIMALGA